MNFQFDVISIGDYAFDVNLGLPKGNGSYGFDKNNKQIYFGQEDKILCDSMHMLLGGNACNVAVGLSRMGFSTSFITHIGDDFTEKLLTDAMTKEKIDLTNALHVKGMAANYSTTIFVDGEKTILIFNHPNIYTFGQKLPAAKMIYVSSLGPNYKEAFNEIITFSSMNKIPLAFNPASHQLKDGVENYLEMIRASSYLFVNKKEAKIITQCNEDGIDTLLAKLLQMGAKNVIITDGVRGAYVSNSDETFFCPIFDMPVLQKTGAGDAFASGFLSGILCGENNARGLIYGTFNSASVIANWGAQAGLLTKDKMGEIINKNNITPQRI